MARPDRRRSAPARPAAAPAAGRYDRPGRGGQLRGGQLRGGQLWAGHRRTGRTLARQAGRPHHGAGLGRGGFGGGSAPGRDGADTHRRRRPGRGQRDTRPAGRPLRAARPAGTWHRRAGRRPDPRSVGQRGQPGPASGHGQPPRRRPGAGRSGLRDGLLARRRPAGRRRHPVRAGRPGLDRGEQLPARGGQRPAREGRLARPAGLAAGRAGHRVLLVAAGQRGKLACGHGPGTEHAVPRRGRVPAAADPAAGRPAERNRGDGDRGRGPGPGHRRVPGWAREGRRLWAGEGRRLWAGGCRRLWVRECRRLRT